MNKVPPQCPRGLRQTLVLSEVSKHDIPELQRLVQQL